MHGAGELDRAVVDTVSPFVREGSALSTILYHGGGHEQEAELDEEQEVQPEQPTAPGIGAAPQPELEPVVGMVVASQPAELHPTLHHLERSQCQLLAAGNIAADLEPASVGLRVASGQHCDTGLLTAIRVGEVRPALLWLSDNSCLAISFLLSSAPFLSSAKLSRAHLPW